MVIQIELFFEGSAVTVSNRFTSKEITTDQRSCKVKQSPTKASKNNSLFNFPDILPQVKGHIEIGVQNTMPILQKSQLFWF